MDDGRRRRPAPGYVVEAGHDARAARDLARVREAGKQRALGRVGIDRIEPVQRRIGGRGPQQPEVMRRERFDRRRQEQAAVVLPVDPRGFAREGNVDGQVELRAPIGDGQRLRV